MRTRRFFAKLVDLLAYAGFASFGARWFTDDLGAAGAAWAGLALGGAYLLFGDALGMSAKNWFGLAVVDVNTGRRCALSSSILRNTPWLAAPLFRVALLHFSGAPLGTPGVALSTGSLAVDVARGAIGALGLMVAVTLWRGLGPDGKGRHWADRWAATRVVSTRAADVQAARDARKSAAPSSTKKAGGRAAPVQDRDAPDFDDAAN